MEYITLMGSEDVSRAGSAISSAASDMVRAANTISDALYRHQQFLEEFIDRMEELQKKKEEL